jgi:RHH-type proline utilization regulon transcriptional repressor/proline dehydrogenase/delta 1-pyrroline-5-carboxylate dehydrogenase
MARASEKQIEKLGKEVFSRMKGETPSVFKKDWWSGKMMDWSMKDEAFKVEMFRFVDVFPTLKDHVQVAEHLQEYFCRPGQDFPSSFQWGLSKVKPDSWVAKKAAGQIEKQITGMASKFIAGTDASEAMGQLRQMWDEDMCFTLDLLGEATVSENEASHYLERYHEIFDTLIDQTAEWPDKPALEKAAWGGVPRVNVSVKISSLYSQLDALDFAGSIEAVKKRLRPLLRKAQAKGAFINIDMESYKHKDLTLATFKSLLEEDEFADFEHAGIVIQAYLKDAQDDVKVLCKWAKKRKTPITVRLVKGAYWDYETIRSQQEGWENPVFTQKWQTDASYETCTETLLDYHKYVHTAIGSHNVRSIAHAMAYADAKKLDKDAVEFQMLFGMAEPMKAAVSSMGYRLRDYVPIGEIIPGMAYLVRRLLENTSNESWLKMSFADGKGIDELLEAPQRPPADQAAADGGQPRHKQPITDHGFRNEPMRDFAHAADRDHFKGALETVRGRLGMDYPLVINNEDVQTDRTIESVNPSRTDQLVGTVAVATIDDADLAIRSAYKAKESWANTAPNERADYLFALADKMREWRDELSGWMVHEVGKNWREADADVCEAIDFCEFYAREMKRLADPKRLGNIPGELNLMFYAPRGIAAIIAPWNFPLAILTGMAMAAAVTGNTVIMKPAEQSSVIAAKLMELCRAVDFPPGVINYLPGIGEEVGEHLVKSPHTDIIAFTGSMNVGLEILRKASDTDPAKQRQVKKVICEMGGKNAIIVDADADLDEAVQGVVQSAFGFQGQKCSACSRAIVLESCYEEFKERVVEATRSLIIGPSDDPAHRIGPVIDAEAQNKINSYIELGKQEGELLIHRQVPESGSYVGPTIVDGITGDDRLAQEEVFGPVLALMKAKDFDEALAIANGTRYALTGGVYSRSPMNIDKSRAQFNVGNLYINQPCTGALVYRQPFGGFKMSGVGSKAGGPDYLLQFLEPRAVTENTMRRGFAPDELI